MIAINIARSGMAVSMMRLNASASNVANADSVGTPVAAPSSSRTPSAVDHAVYQPTSVSQQVEADGGVVGIYVKAKPGTVPRYDPSSSAANRAAMVAAPNVDLVDERVQQVIAKSDFQANVAVIRIAEQMQKTTIDLLA